MSFDARSRERLEALGRTLPQPLPAPEPKAKGPDPAAPRHAVETERDPEQLFRELMGASRDGTVPPHLLDRLRQLEQARAPQGKAQQARAPQAGSLTQPPAGAAASPASAPAAPRPQRNQLRRAGIRAATDADAALYTEFQQLLLEDDDEVI